MRWRHGFHRPLDRAGPRLRCLPGARPAQRVRGVCGAQRRFPGGVRGPPTLSYTLQGYVGYIFVFWFYLYVVDVRHFDLLRGALFGALPWLLSIVSIPLGGARYDRLGARRNLVPIAGLAGSGLLIAAGANTGNAWLAAVCLALATALVLSVEGPFWATMTRIAGGVMNMGSNLGGFVSPALTPILAQWMGWDAALMVSAAAAVVAALLWLGVDEAGASST